MNHLRQCQIVYNIIIIIKWTILLKQNWIKIFIDMLVCTYTFFYTNSKTNLKTTLSLDLYALSVNVPQTPWIPHRKKAFAIKNINSFVVNWSIFWKDFNSFGIVFC